MGRFFTNKLMVYADALKAVGDPTKRKEIGAAIGAVDEQNICGRLRFDPATHLAVQGNEDADTVLPALGRQPGPVLSKPMLRDN